jgi:hypothetical protein
MPVPQSASPPPPVSLAVRRSLRVEYLGFQSVGDHREYRLASYGPDASVEYRFRIPFTAFGAGRLRLQDGPDVCYQKLLRALADGETASGVILIDEADLAIYREAHTHVPKHRARTPSSTPRPPYVPPVAPRPRIPTPPPVLVVEDKGPQLGEGQRVSHALYGVGVTSSSGGGHTVVRFDGEGSKTFVTSMVELELLSAPHTWETTPRGKNRPR